MLDVIGVSQRGAAQAPKVDVTGKWAFNVETAAGAGTPTMTFKQDGEKLTGHYTGTFGEAEGLTGASVQGAPTISLLVRRRCPGHPSRAYTGTADKDTMKGKLVIEGLGEGTFTAKRQ